MIKAGIVLLTCILNVAYCLNYSLLHDFARQRKLTDAKMDDFTRLVFDLAKTRYADVLSSNDFPHYSIDNGANWHMEPASSWIVGFLPGIYWNLYIESNLQSFKDLAFKSQERFKYRQTDKSTHDLGFVMLNSYYKTLLLKETQSANQEQEYQKIILNSAQSLASRFNWLVGCIRSWNNVGKTGFQVIIDNMMNLELLLVAAQIPGGNSDWTAMAKSHADMTLKNHIRSDGSTYHVIVYDEYNGTVIDARTHQGWASNSTWARGQAWGIYGFAKMFLYTKDQRYLDASIKLLDYYFSRMPFNHYVPKWDFSAPGSGLILKNQDTSAAVIIASALSDLAKLTLNPLYKQVSINTYLYLFNRSADYIPDDSYNRAGVMHHGTSNQPKNLTDHALIYGDYYLLEGLLKL